MCYYKFSQFDGIQIHQITHQTSDEVNKYHISDPTGFVINLTSYLQNKHALKPIKLHISITNLIFIKKDYTLIKS